MVVSVEDLTDTIEIHEYVFLVIVLLYNGGMAATVEIKVCQLGDRIQVRSVMIRINVRITIWFHVHLVAIIPT